MSVLHLLQFRDRNLLQQQQHRTTIYWQLSHPIQRRWHFGDEEPFAVGGLPAYSKTYGPRARLRLNFLEPLDPPDSSSVQLLKAWEEARPATPASDLELFAISHERRLPFTQPA